MSQMDTCYKNVFDRLQEARLAAQEITAPCDMAMHCRIGIEQIRLFKTMVEEILENSTKVELDIDVTIVRNDHDIVVSTTVGGQQRSVVFWPCDESESLDDFAYHSEPNNDPYTDSLEIIASIFNRLEVD